MRDLATVDAELGQPVDGLVRMDDHTGRDRERLPPGVARALPHSHRRVVGGEHQGAAAREPPQPADVELRSGEPLHVDHVGRELVDPAQQASNARDVLRAFEEPTEARSRRRPQEAPRSE
jgi:hypothetical protein